MPQGKLLVKLKGLIKKMVWSGRDQPNREATVDCVRSVNIRKSVVEVLKDESLK